MATAAIYSRDGRIAMWGLASAHMYQELTDGEGDYLNDIIAIAAWGGATGALWIPEVVPYMVGRGLHAGSAAAWNAVRAAAPYAWVAVTAAAPFTAGYTIGATVGTAIANKIWGEEGAQVALGFYSGGSLPGPDAPNLTDYQYIFKPTAPGGPVSAYDVGKKGVDNTLTGIGWWINRQTQRPGFPGSGNPYAI